MEKLFANRMIRGIAAAAISMALLLPTFGTASASGLTGTTATYTLDGDFNTGTLVNVYHNAPNSDQLQLDNDYSTFNFMWVPISSKGTIVKIDTDTGAVLGEYRSSPLGRAADPSRTSVDSNGNVWAANAAEASAVPASAISPGVPVTTRPMGSVVKIGLKEKGQCVDRNGNGVIDTSTGLGDIRSWSNDGGANNYGGVSTSADECILQYVRTNAHTANHVSVNANNNVWVSGTGYKIFDLVSGSTGQIIVMAGTVSAGGYGGLIDNNGFLWSSRPLLRWNASSAMFTGTNGDPAGNSVGPFINGANWASQSAPDSYGLCVNPNNGEVWNTQVNGNLIHRYAADGTWLGAYQHGDDNGQGCAIDSNNHVWVAHSLYRSTVGHLDGNGNLLGIVTTGQGPTAVDVDANGKILTTGYYSQAVSRIDPTLNGGIGAVELTTANLGGYIYAYGDMTGNTLALPLNTGTWSVTHDSEKAGAEWGKITWNSEAEGATPGNSTLTVQARSSEDGTNWGAYEDAVSGADLTVANGRYLQVIVTFTRSTTTDANNDGIGDSPVLSDLKIEAVQEIVQVSAYLDVRPGSCPNPLNVKSKGHLPVALVGTAEFDVSQIDPASIRLEGVAPERIKLKDVANPYTGGISDPPDKNNCNLEIKDKKDDKKDNNAKDDKEPKDNKAKGDNGKKDDKAPKGKPAADEEDDLSDLDIDDVDITSDVDSERVKRSKDGITDIAMKFDNQAITAAITAAHGPLTKGQVVVVTLTATTMDGKQVTAKDVVWIRGAKK